jgi:hypothetical protein
MSEFKVFYSWQSDLPNSTNRIFIGKALSTACEQVSKNPDIEYSPRLDQDTQGVSGSPAIPATIMEKIDECQVFVADVSLSFNGPKDKVAPNPNVMFELGYAVARLGWDRIILVMNLENGPIDSLPFDLEKRRVTGPYKAAVGEQDRSEEKKSLASRLASGIAAIAQLDHTSTKNKPADDSIEAVNGQSPTSKVAVRQYRKWALDKLERQAPQLPENPEQKDQIRLHIDLLKDALTKTTTLLCDWSRVCEAVALSGNSDIACELTNIFPAVLSFYDKLDGKGGHVYHLTFDYWRFLGHELFTIWIACLLKESRWDLIAESIAFLRVHTSKSVVSEKDQGGFHELSADVRLLQADSALRSIVSAHADLLRDMISGSHGDLTVSYKEFIDADVFLYLLAYFSDNKEPDDFVRWFPWSAIYLSQTPDFLVKARHQIYAKDLKEALGFRDSASARDALMKLSRELTGLWGFHSHRFEIDRRDIVAFDSTP